MHQTKISKKVFLVLSILGVDKIDSLTISIPSEGIDYLGIGDHSSTEDLHKVTDSETDIDNPTRKNAIE